MKTIRPIYASRKLFVFLASCLLVLSLLIVDTRFGTVFAQEQVTQQSENSGAPAKPEVTDPESWKAVLDSIERALGREGLGDQDLDKLLQDAGRVSRQAGEQIATEQKDLDLLKQRVDGLGPAPKDNEPPESPEAQKQRETIGEQFAAQDARIKKASDVQIRAQQLSETISERRHDRFFREISVRAPDLLTPTFWDKFTSGFKGFWRSIYLLVSDSASIFAKSLSSAPYKLFVLLFAIPLAALLYLRATKILGWVRTQIPEHSDNRAVEGFVFYLSNGVLPAILLFAIHSVLSRLELLTARLDEFLFALIMSVSFLFVIRAVIRVVIAPYEPERRIAGISNIAAKNIYRIGTIGLITALGVFLLNRLAVIFVLPLEVKIGLSFIFCVIIGGTALWLSYLYRRDYLTEKKAVGSISLPRFWRAFTIVLWFVGALILISALAGYIAFSEFISQQLVFGIVVVLTAWLLLRFVDFLFLHMPAENYVGEDTEESAIMGANGQIAILTAGISKLLIYVGAFASLMLPWGYRTSDFFQIFEQFFFGFEVGGLSISIYTVLLAIALFFIGYTVTVGLKNWLNDKLLPTTSLDIGISNSISTVFGYIGVIIAAMLAVSAAGFDLSNLAIVAGALSVGVGFGLQSIVNNFVSGLILLAERPIKAGDWIETSGGSGYVRKISVRSTEIETFDRATVIVPNSSLITDNVTNWTHGNKTGRIIIPVGVAYDSDPEQVKELLLECAKQHKLVLGRPAPAVFFMDFGASSLDFELRCFLSDINYGLTVKSDIRFMVLKALQDADISIPFPHRELLIKTENGEEPLLAKPAPPARKSRAKGKD